MLTNYEQEVIARQSERITKMRESKDYFYDFLGKQIIVKQNVFYPSADTKLLAENIKVNANDIVLECCAGTGAISLTIADKVKEIYCSDISPYCVENINENVKKFGLTINAYMCDLFPSIDKKYDVIIIAPPYTDKDAKDVVEQAYWDKNHKTTNKFLTEAKNYLNANSRIYLCWADFADFNLIENLFAKYNYKYKQTVESEYKGKKYRVYELTL